MRCPFHCIATAEVYQLELVILKLRSGMLSSSRFVLSCRRSVATLKPLLIRFAPHSPSLVPRYSLRTANLPPVIIAKSASRPLSTRLLSIENGFLKLRWGRSEPFVRTQQSRSINFNLPRSEGPNEWETISKLSIPQRLKYMLKKYWYIAIPLHAVTSIMWFGTMYLLCK